MQELKQITLAFDEPPEPVVPEKESIPEALLPPKKRGRKPKPAPLVPKKASKRGRLS